MEQFWERALQPVPCSDAQKFAVVQGMSMEGEVGDWGRNSLGNGLAQASKWEMAVCKVIHRMATVSVGQREGGQQRLGVLDELGAWGRTAPHHSFQGLLDIPGSRWPHSLRRAFVQAVPSPRCFPCTSTPWILHTFKVKWSLHAPPLYTSAFSSPPGTSILPGPALHLLYSIIFTAFQAII